MDQRRFVAFLALSMAVLMLSSLLFPQPRPKPAAKPGAPAADKPPVAANDKPAADKIEAPAGDVEQAPGAQAIQAAPPAVEEKEVSREYVTLGSLDPESGYRMLVTLTNAGAAVQRVELSSPRYTDLHDWSGYLGQLALEPVDGGLKVQVVGAGTPAAKADLRVGDVIVDIAGNKVSQTAVRAVDELHAALAKFQPGQEANLNVIRDGGAPVPVKVQLVRRPLDVMRPEIENIRMRDGQVPNGFVDPPSFLLSLAKHEVPAPNAEAGDLPKAVAEVRGASSTLETGNWEVVAQDASSVMFRRTLPALNLEIIKRYTLAPVPAGSRGNENYPGYDFHLDIEVRNIGSAPQTVAYTLDGPTGLPIEGWWYAHKISQRWMSAAGLRDVALRYHGGSEQQIDCSTIANDQAKPIGQGDSLAYIGVDAVYFSAILIPEKASLDDDWFESTEAVRVGPKLEARTPITYTNVTCRLTRTPVELAPGKSQRDSYQVFVGPKRPELLEQYQAAGDPNYSLRDLIYYGWFGVVARWMLATLHFFYSIVGNYGIAIIMLTVLVRGAMFPISFKQTKNMARMQALKPEMDRITEKYKGDMQKRSQAINDLYRKNNINPLGGCLPLFLQLPIFIGLYRSIMVDVELRQTPLFGHAIRWCSDLSAPDMLFDWSGFMPDMVNNGIGILGLGRYFNVLPIVTVCLFLVTQKMAMPEPTNEQAAMQQKMMKYMTGFMGLLFYKVASGLCLYFIASSLWGLCERKLLGKTSPSIGPTTTKPGTATGGRDAKSGGGGGSGNGRNGSAGSKSSKARRRK